VRAGASCECFFARGLGALQCRVFCAHTGAHGRRKFTSQAQNRQSPSQRRLDNISLHSRLPRSTSALISDLFFVNLACSGIPSYLPTGYRPTLLHTDKAHSRFLQKSKGYLQRTRVEEPCIYYQSRTTGCDSVAFTAHRSVDWPAPIVSSLEYRKRLVHKLVLQSLDPSAEQR